MIQMNITDSVDYTAGSNVSGNVSISGDDSSDIQNISISFCGQCETEIETLTSTSPLGARYTKKYHGELPFFRQGLILFDGPTTRQVDTTWPFSFTFPSQCDPPMADMLALGRFTFRSDPIQSLPPSCTDMYVTPMSSGHLRFSVFYQLEACVVAKDSKRGSVSSKWSSKLNFISRQTSRHSGAIPCFMSRRINCQSVHLMLKDGTRGAAIQPPSFRERIVGTRSEQKGRVGTATFELKVCVPTVAIINEDLPLVLSIDHDTEFSTTPSPPVVLLKHVKAILKADTAIRCDNGRQMGNWSRDYTVIDHSFSQPTPITENMELIGLKLRQGLIPTFKSFIIQTTHALVIEVTVECGQRHFTNKFGTHDRFVLLPQGHSFRPDHYDDALGPPSSPAEEPDLGPPSISDMDPPPPYAEIG